MSKHVCHNIEFLFLKVEDRKDSDDEKSDRNRPWWKKRFVSAIPKGDAFKIFFFFMNLKMTF